MKNHKQLMNHFEEAAKVNTPYYFMGHLGACPDTLGSAMGLVRLAHERGLETKIAGDFGASTGYPTNAELLRFSEVDLINPSNVQKGDRVMFVDCHPGGTNLFEVKGEVVAVLDHHPIREGEEEFMKNLAFVEIDPEYKAAASLVVDHLYAEFGKDRWLSKDSAADRILATVLMQGIRTDTKKLIIANKRDLGAVTRLEGLANKGEISSWEDVGYPPELRTLLKRAQWVSVGPYIGYVIPSVGNPDLVSPFTDLVTSFTGHQVYIVMAEILGVEDTRPREWLIKGRSKSAAYDATEILTKVFGKGSGKDSEIDSVGGVNVSYDYPYTRFGVSSDTESPIVQILSGIKDKFNGLVEVRKKKEDKKV
ncbi:MAG: hypothetical protein ABH849_04770 [Nanoarchaeota archaeon]